MKVPIAATVVAGLSVAAIFYAKSNPDFFLDHGGPLWALALPYAVVESLDVALTSYMSVRECREAHETASSSHDKRPSRRTREPRPESSGSRRRLLHARMTAQPWSSSTWHTHRVRTWTLWIVLVACGGETKPAEPTQAQKPVAVADAWPRLVAGPSTVVPHARPTAVVWIDAAGTLAVGEATHRAGPRTVVQPERVRHAVLTTIADGGGTHAGFAKIDRGDLDENATMPAPPESTERRPAARVIPLTALDPTSPLVYVDPDAPATVLARALIDTGGALAAPHATELAILDHAFELTVDRKAVADGWIEVHVDAAAIHVVGVPDGGDVEIPATASDADWRAALDRLSAGGPTKSVDILVGPGPTAQALVDLVARLARVGVGDLAVGEARVTLDQRRQEIVALRDQAKMAPPGVRIGGAMPAPEIGLGNTAIQQTVYLARGKVRECYQKQLAVNPKLSGKVKTSFWVEPNGTVTDATATGMDGEVAACIADAIAALRFPKRRGTRIHVNFPFLFQTQ
jgi:hypothetical protein